MYESGNEDKIEPYDFTIESINNNIKEKEFENLQRENETLKKMVETRNNELKKEDSQDKILALSKVLGIDNMKNQIDELNNGQNAIIGKMTEIIQGMNNITATISGQTPLTESTQENPLQKLQLIEGLISKAGEFYNIYKQNQTPHSAPALIDQDFINRRMVESFMEELDTGKSISTFIKNSLKKTASRNIVSTALKDIGNADNNEPA